MGQCNRPHLQLVCSGDGHLKPVVEPNDDLVRRRTESQQLPAYGVAEFGIVRVPCYNAAVVSVVVVAFAW